MRSSASAPTLPRRTAMAAVSALVLIGPSVTPTAASAQDDAFVVYLVRHAERAEDGTSDPVISLPGWDRARLLARMLADAGISHIHTTDYRRTRGTGRPLADELGIEMEVYDPFDLESFADELRHTPGRHLVLGHSNTTPDLVTALGGYPGTPIDDAEYDRLYVVTLTPTGVSTVLLRFGAPFEG